MVLMILHTLQYLFFLICAPLLVFLIYALLKNWRETTPRVSPAPGTDPLAEYQRGYADGYADGHEAANSELATVCCSMTETNTASSEEDPA